MKHFDYVVIGGGSGGIASARRAASYGARVAVIEAKKLGGTCVNVGCVPKKLMFNAASVGELLRDAPGYGFSVERGRFDWQGVKARRDEAVARLVSIYAANLNKSEIETISGRAKVTARNTVEVNGERLEARHILIATGAYPKVADIAGAHLGITSNGFFDLREQPKHVAIIGTGYIGVEFAGIFQALGTRVSLFTRHNRPLPGFDSLLRNELKEQMVAAGIDLKELAEPQRVTRADNGLLRITTKDQREFGGFDQLIWAIGRIPASAGLGLDVLGVELDEFGFIRVDAHQNTAAEGIYAVGDVTRQPSLTPVAIAAGRALADRLFGGKPAAALDLSSVPTVVFSHPPIGTVGMSEELAREQYADDVKVYTSRFTNLFYSMTQHKPKTAMKIVTQASTDRVLGIHVLGMGADEMIQGFAVAVRMGATKADLDRTIAIHPTAAEELVTML